MCVLWIQFTRTYELSCMITSLMSSISLFTFQMAPLFRTKARKRITPLQFLRLQAKKSRVGDSDNNRERSPIDDEGTHISSEESVLGMNEPMEQDGEHQDFIDEDEVMEDGGSVDSYGEGDEGDDEEGTSGGMCNASMRYYTRPPRCTSVP